MSFFRKIRNRLLDLNHFAFFEKIECQLMKYVMSFFIKFRNRLFRLNHAVGDEKIENLTT